MTATPRPVAAGRPANVLSLSPAVRQARFRSAAARAALLRAALGLSVLIAVARGVVLLLTSLQPGRPDLTSSALVRNLLTTLGALTIATVVAAAVTWLLWVAWTSRLEQNAPALGLGENSVGARGAILWWLVPGFNLLVPFGQLLGLDRRLTGGEQRSRDALLGVWWLALLVTAAATIATSVPLPSDASVDGSNAPLFLDAALAAFAWGVAGLLSIRVVRQVQADEDRRAAIIRAGWRPGAPSWPVTLPGAPKPGWASAGSAGGYPAAAAPALRPIPGSMGVRVPPTVPAAARPTSPIGAAATRPSTAANQTSARWGSAPNQPAAQPGPGSQWGAVMPRRRSGRAPGWVIAVVFVAVIAGALASGAGLFRRSTNSGGIGPIAIAEPTRAAATPIARPTAAATATSTLQAVASVPPTPSPSSAPAATPTPVTASAGTALLMQHVTGGDGACAAMDSPDWPAGSLAAINCRPGNAAVASLTYALYTSADDAEAAYLQELAAANVTAASGDCFDAVPGESNYSTDGTPRGRVFCQLGSGDGIPTVTWFDRTLAIVGRATGTGTDLAPLCAWWAKESGPE